MTQFLCIGIAIISLSSLVLNAADRKDEAEPNTTPILSVCEALRDRALYSNSTVIIVGRWSGTDEGSWLDEKCGLRLIIGERVYPVAISTTFVRSEALPAIAPAPETPQGFRWNKQRLKRVLDAVKKTTQVEHRTDSYAAVYGRLESEIPRKLKLRDGRTAIFNGYGHLGEAPAQIVWPYKGGYVKLGGN